MAIGGSEAESVKEEREVADAAAEDKDGADDDDGSAS